MGIIDRLRRGSSSSAGPAVTLTGAAGDEQRWTLAEAPEIAFSAFGASRVKAGTRVSIGTALELLPVYACVTLISSTVGMTPCFVYAGRGRDRQEATNAPQWDLLHEEPNDEMAPDQFFETVAGHLLLWGNAYLEKERTRGTPIPGALWPHIPSRVEVERDERSPYAKRFHIAGESRTYTADEILHVPGFNYDGLKGLSPIGAARQAIGTAIARSDFEADFYANGAVMSGYLQKEGSLTKQQKAELRESWDAIHTGAGARHRTGVLSDGLTWQPAGMSMIDLQFVEQAQLAVADVCRIFLMPPEMIGGKREGLQYSTVEGQWTNYTRQTVARWFSRIERAFRRDPALFPRPKEIAPKFKLDALLRGDSKARAEFYTKLAALKAISVEEIRELEDMGPIREGDTFPTPAGAPAGEGPEPPDDEPDEQPDEPDEPDDAGSSSSSS